MPSQCPADRQHRTHSEVHVHLLLGQGFRTDGYAQQEVLMWLLDIWTLNTAAERGWSSSGGDAGHINVRGVRRQLVMGLKGHWACSTTRDQRQPRICICNCRTWTTRRCQRVTSSHNNNTKEVGSFYIILLLQQWLPTYRGIWVLWSSESVSHVPALSIVVFVWLLNAANLVKHGAALLSCAWGLRWGCFLRH